MHFDTVALSAEDFQGWVDKAKAGDGKLDADRYTQLARPSDGDPPTTFSTVAPDLFQTVIDDASGYKAGATPAPAPSVPLSATRSSHRSGPAGQGEMRCWAS